MRVGIFTESFLPQVNGVVTAICSSAGVLSKRHDVEIFTVGKGPNRAAGCKVHRFRGVKLPTYKEYRFFVPSSNVWKRLSSVRLDIAHVRSSVGFGLVALRFARKRRIPLVGTFDTPITDYVHYVPLLGGSRHAKRVLSKAALKYTVWFYNQCDAVIAPSPSAAEWLRKAGCRRGIHVISNGVDTKRFNPKRKNSKLREKLCPNGETLLLHVGRITMEKSVDVLVDAAKELKSSGLGFVLVIAGSGPALPDLKQKVKSIGLGGCVKFAGFVPDKELPEYYASADVFVTASTVETEGIVLLEAMASGLPVVGADAGAIPTVLKNGKNGFLFKAGDCAGLAKKVANLADPKTRKRVSSEALRLSRQYSIEKTTKKLENMYKELIK